MEMVKYTCNYCRGSGASATTYDRRCQWCVGTGYHMRPKAHIDPVLEGLLDSEWHKENKR